MSEKIFRNRATAIIHDFIKNNEIKEKFILPANICPIVPLVFYKNKIQVKFLDIDKKTLNICKDKVFSEIKNSSGILWNYTYGKETNQKNFFKDLKKMKENYLIIDDKCLCIPNTKFKKSLYSDLEIYSTGYSKYCDMDYGGYGISKKKLELFKTKYLKSSEHRLKNKIDKFISQKKKYSNKEINWLKNQKINNSNFYIKSIEKLKNKVNTHKKKINLIYCKNIPSEIILDKKANNWRFNILVNKKEKLLKEIFCNGLFASSHFYSSSKLFKSENNTYSDILSKNVLNLFNDFRFNESNALKICEIITKHYNKYGPGKRP
tara:strand:+ start:495 stop:1454 length:960 start_codon:yes stop_codon:yes gene_type:complete